MHRIKILLILLISCSIGFAQKEYSTESKKAIKLFEKAGSEFDNRNFMEAEELLKKAIETDSAFFEAHLFLADLYNYTKQFDKELEAYQPVIRQNPKYFPKVFYNQAQTLYKKGEYAKALKSISFYIDSCDVDERIEKQVLRLFENCKFSVNAIENPVPFDPINLGPKVNTKYDDYWPSLTLDEQTLVITTRLPRYPNIKEYTLSNTQEDFAISLKDSLGYWSTSRNIGPPINTKENEGAQCLSYDGKYWLFTACNRPRGKGSCDIYFSIKKNGKWLPPILLQSPVNTRAWETSPTLSSNNKELIFSSNRKGGKGKKDLWMVSLNEQGQFANAQNLCDSINTPGDEIAPFLHPDNQTLYFASDGHPGLGGLDLFMSRKDSITGKWQKPVNLGYPINTKGNEFGLIVNAKGDMAYFSSERENSQRKDIYEFELYPGARPQKVLFVKGKVFDFKTEDPLAAECELIDLKTGESVASIKSDEYTGEYMIALPVNKDYAFNASKQGYLFYSENFSLKGMGYDPEPYYMDIPMQPIEVDKSVILKNIFFEFDSYALKPESKTELFKLQLFLEANPTVNIEIGGHTDNKGSKEYNQDLSENRAKTVADYLINEGINKSRITYKGYNFSVPIADNNTEEGRALNRRTEFKITSK